MNDEITELKNRVAALEWALAQLPMVLTGEIGFPYHAYPQWIYMTAKTGLSHGAISKDVHDALIRLGDEISGIESGLPAYLKQLRRDFPPESPDTPGQR